MISIFPQEWHLRCVALPCLVEQALSHSWLVVIIVQPHGAYAFNCCQCRPALITGGYHFRFHPASSKITIILAHRLWEVAMNAEQYADLDRVSRKTNWSREARTAELTSDGLRPLVLPEIDAAV